MKSSWHVERQVRIELLRARAELERQELCAYSREFGRSVQPSNLLNATLGAKGGRLSSMAVIAWRLFGFYKEMKQRRKLRRLKKAVLKT